MKMILPLLTGLLASCAGVTTKSTPVVRQPTVAPEASFTLEKALSQKPAETVKQLQKQITAKSFKEKDGKLEELLPDSLRGPVPVASASSRPRQQYLNKFRSYTTEMKIQRATELSKSFQCEQATESQALAFSLERNFPEASALTSSYELHQKVISCDDYAFEESLWKLTVRAIHNEDCKGALKYLKKLPANQSGQAQSRQVYLQSRCSKLATAAEANTLSGYGILTSGLSLAKQQEPIWYLTTESGSEDWDRLLATLARFSEKNEHQKVRYLVSKLNLNELNKLPYPFQASVLTLMHFAGADLSVFQTLHRYLVLNPEMLNLEVAKLLYPVRYWSEINKYRGKVDPILIKALIRQESAFNPTARSPAKAFGLMQVIYPTARMMGLKKKKDLFVPEKNIKTGVKYLERLLEEFGSPELALAAYNAGPGAVRDWQKRYPMSDVNLFVEMIPYTETREYVRLVLRNYTVYKFF